MDGSSLQSHIDEIRALRGGGDKHRRSGELEGGRQLDFSDDGVRDLAVVSVRDAVQSVWIGLAMLSLSIRTGRPAEK
jgi:hypothetical protein